MEKTIIFVYAKDNKIKILNLEQSKISQKDLLESGWIHTSTLDACAYIQYLHNDCEDVDLIDEMKSLSNIKNLKH